MPKLAPISGIYGKAKVGKSSQLAELVAGKGIVFTNSKSAMLPAETYIGLPEGTIRQQVTTNLTELRKGVREAAAKYPIVGVDDLSQTIKRTGGAWKELHKQIMGLLTEDMYAARDKYNTLFVITMHEQEERRTSTNKPVRGGPEMPGQAPEEFSGYLDTIVRAVYDEQMELWPVVYWSRIRANWIAGDRMNVIPDCAPMNLAEGIRMYGLDVPRPFDWMEADVNALAKQMAALEDIRDWRTPAKEYAAKNMSRGRPIIKWVVRDALHRAIYRNAATIDKWLEVADTVIV